MTDNKNYKQTLDNFYRYLDEILCVYEDAIPVLQEEFTAISKDNLELLNQNLKVQQALFLKTKQFDIKVADYLEKLNMPTANLSAMIAELPKEESEPFKEILSRFDVAGKNVLFYRDKCKALLQQKLYRIDKVLELYEANSQNTLYGNNAAEVHSSTNPTVFQTRV